MRLPENSEPGTRPYFHLPTVFDFAGFSASAMMPSQYWQANALPLTIRGIICGVPQPGASGCDLLDVQDSLDRVFAGVGVERRLHVVVERETAGAVEDTCTTR